MMLGTHDYRQVLLYGPVILDAAGLRTAWADLSVDWLVGWAYDLVGSERWSE